MKTTSLFAVLFGSGVGVAAALGGRAGVPDEPPPLPAAAVRPLDVRNEPARKSERGERDGPERSVLPPVVPPAEAPPEADQPVRSKEEFQAAAVACDEKDAGACRRAARASELGEVVPKDEARAKTFRKVELTALVRACEKGGVDACLVLADRYLRGDGLERNERTASALIEHTKTLCAKKLEPACQRVPTN
jgi:TPR repeat protein